MSQAHPGVPNPPQGFKTLDEVLLLKGESVNIIGVVRDFLEPAKTRGTDWAITFTLHDPAWREGLGLKVRIFQKAEDLLPRIQNQGDVVILRNVKLNDYNGQQIVLSNFASTWSVLEHASLNDSTAVNGSDITIKQGNVAPHPTISDLRYAKAILELENPNNWPPPPKPTAAQVASIMTQNGGTAPLAYQKFKEVKDCILPSDKQYIFAELFGEVRKVYAHDMKCELYITDYTTNPFVFDYKRDEDGADGRDGDSYGYIPDTPKSWPGPWGKTVLPVILWPPHRDFALNKVKEDDYVYLKNVQVKFDKMGRLEGHCRGDPLYPTKINVIKYRPNEAGNDDQFKAVLRRKREYEEMCKQKGWRLLRASGTNKRKLELAGPRDAPIEDSVDAKTKRNRERKAKRRNKDKDTDKSVKDGDSDAIVNADNGSGRPNVPDSLINRLNENVRCKNEEIGLTTIRDIMSPSTLSRATPVGNVYQLPFQNAIYKSRLRVVDFFPSDIQDFCAPVRNSEYAVLSDAESAGDVDPTQEDVEMSDGSENGAEAGSVKWEWRFFLLVQGASTPQGQEPAMMELLVADTDADFLFNSEACDLRQKRNNITLAKLREKLWTLWGDLEEKKGEAQDGAVLDGVRTNIKPSGRPFECFIKEYGIPSPEEEDEWQRMFRLCWTSI